MDIIPVIVLGADYQCHIAMIIIAQVRDNVWISHPVLELMGLTPRHRSEVGPTSSHWAPHVLKKYCWRVGKNPTPSFWEGASTGGSRIFQRGPLSPVDRNYCKEKLFRHGRKPAAGENKCLPPTLSYVAFSALSEEEMGFHQARTGNSPGTFKFSPGTNMPAGMLK